MEINMEQFQRITLIFPPLNCTLIEEVKDSEKVRSGMSSMYPVLVVVGTLSKL